MKYLFGIIFVFSFFSCSQTREEEEITVLNRDMIYGTLPIDSVIQEWSYTVLETDKNCLIGDINKIEIDDTLLFIESQNGSEFSLYMFYKSGRFGHQIGSVGRAPEEYISLSAWCIDRFNKEVYVMDRFRKRVVKYGYDGRFKAAMELNPSYSMVYDMAYFRDSIFCLKNYIPGQHNASGDSPRFIITNKQFHPIAYSASENLVADYIVKPFQNSWWESEAGVYAMTVLNDTIYKLNESCSFVPAFYLDLEKVKLKDVNFNSHHYNQIRNNLVAQGYNVYKQCFLLNNLLFVCSEDSYLMNLENYRGVKLNNIDSCQQIIYPNRWLSSYKEVLIGTSKVSDLYSDEELGKDMLYYDKVKQLLSLLKEDSNPVLFFYRFRGIDYV